MEQTAPQNSHDHSKHANNTTLMAVLAYLGILIVIPFLMAKDDPFVKFHLRQGAVLFIIEIAAWVLGMISWSFWPIVHMINLGTLVLAIIGIINVINHKEAELPLVGQFSKHVNI